MLFQQRCGWYQELLTSPFCYILHLEPPLYFGSMYLQVNPNAIFVHKRQEGNPVLKHIRNVRWQFADIVPDYQMGQTTCAVFLSLRCTTFEKLCP